MAHPQQAQQSAFLRSNQGKVDSFIPQNMQQSMQQGSQGQLGGMNQAILAQIASLPPEEQEAAMRKYTQDFQGKGAAATKQMDKAQGTMDGKSPQGREAGRVYVAANPLEHLADAYKKNRAQKSYDSGVADSKKLSDSFADASYDYMNAGVQDYNKNY